MAWLSLCCLVAAGPNLLVNGDFEDGAAGWPHANEWYAQPPGAGVSAAVIGEGEGRGGSRALKLVGGARRGIALQSRPAYPGRYRVRGWARCAGLGAATGGVLVEWIGPEAWIAGEQVLTITADAEWTAFDAIVIAPPKTRSVHFDLLTNHPNDGTIWFDEMTMERLPSELPPPPAPVLRAEAPAGEDACLDIHWQPELADQAVFVLLYLDGEPLPALCADAAAGGARLRSLANGRAYRLTAVASDADGQVSATSTEVVATPADRQPPRPGWPEAVRLDGRLIAGWRPHVLDHDVVRLGIAAPGGGEPLAVVSVDSASETCEVRQPVDSDAGRLGFWCEDAAGHRSETAWTDVRPASAADAAPGPWDAWLVGPHVQLPRDCPPVTDGPKQVALTVLRGQTYGCQLMLRPREDLHGVRVLPPRGDVSGDYRFVDYLELDRNSRATPPEELVWSGPAAYPDELADDPVRDLPAGLLQPIYLRLSVGRGVAPGDYDVPFELLSAEGRETFTVAVHVPAVTLPEETRLKFVYWFDPNESCRHFGVDPDGADGWRALLRTAQMMRRYHQNTVVVPWGLVHGWQRPDGTIAADFGEFDRYVDTFRAAGVEEVFCLSHMGGRTTGDWECPTFSEARATVRRLPDGAPVDIPAYDLLPAIQDHLEARGLLDRFTVHVADEPIAVNRASWLALSAKVHEKAPKIRRIDAIHIPDLEGGLEVWVPQLNYLKQWQTEYEAVQAAGGELWFYVAWVPQGMYPNRMIDNAAIKPRMLHWMHYVYGTTGYLHWALNRWSMDLMGLVSPGDTTIVWASDRDIADSSLRYEAERLGIEDLELMYLAQEALEARGVPRQEAVARIRATIAEGAAEAEGFTRDWLTVEAVRRRLIALAGG